MENSVIMLVLKFKKEMNQQTTIVKQIQELEKLVREMCDAKNFNYEIFEQISQQIAKYQSQQKKLAKLADEAKYLEEVEIMALYQENGGKESMAFANGIGGKQPSLDDHFNDFLTGNVQSQVVFICENNHWLTVRLEKTPDGGITYQVADSMPENPTQNKFNREERIDALLGTCTKIPFKSEKQQNGYDCGIYCALNAVDMKPNVVEEHKYFNAKSTYSKHDVDAIRKNFENQPKPKDVVKQPMPQQPPKESAKEDELINALKNKFEQGSITTEQAIKSIELIKGRVENTLHNAFEQEDKSELQQKYIERLLNRIDALTDFEKELNQTKQQQQTSRLSSASTAFSLQRPRSASAPRSRSNISIRELPELKALKPAIRNRINNKPPKGFHTV